jgi:hypothetical protein
LKATAQTGSVNSGDLAGAEEMFALKELPTPRRQNIDCRQAGDKLDPNSVAAATCSTLDRRHREG